MSFVSRIVRIQSPSYKLSDGEKSNDPSLLAVERLNIAPQTETQFISPPRASGLHNACMRQLVLGVQNKIRKKDFLSNGDLVTYGIGRAMHTWVQNSNDVLGKRRRGYWRCLACGAIRQFGAPPTTKCPKCGANPEASLYHEFFGKITKPFYIQGHPDMFLEVAPGIIRVVEIKSMAGAQFDTLRSPLAQHEWQVLSYLLVLQYDRKLPVKVDSKLGYVLYISKKQAGKGKLPYKMFAVKRNPATMAVVKGKLLEYKTGIEGGPLPKVKNSCFKSNFSNYESKFCPVRKLCLEAGGNATDG